MSCNQVIKFGSLAHYARGKAESKFKGRAQLKENPLRGLTNRLLQHLARILPGAQTLRVSLHRARGVHVGKGVWIGYDVILETSRPYLVTIEDGSSIGMRVTVIGHFRESQGVKIEHGAFVGPGVIILPNVVIGRGAVVTAGSVVTQSVPPMTVVQGNPAVPVARCGIPLGKNVSLKEFSGRLKPLASSGSRPRGGHKTGADMGETEARIEATRV